MWWDSPKQKIFVEQNHLDDPCNVIAGVGKVTHTRLTVLGLATVGDVLNEYILRGDNGFDNWLRCDVGVDKPELRQMISRSIYRFHRAGSL